jgi:hypothetical protein
MMVTSHSAKLHLRGYRLDGLLSRLLVKLQLACIGYPEKQCILQEDFNSPGFPVSSPLWGISDADAPTVAGHTYKYLFRNGMQDVDPSEVATALNRAVLRLHNDLSVTVDRWAPFIHFGI